MKTIKLKDENLIGQPGLCPFIKPSINWQRDIDNYDICIYTDRLCFSELDSSKSNYAWIIEPPIINGENYRDIVKIASNFKKVFSYMRHLENVIPNYVFCPHGGTWLKEEEINLNSDNKSKLTSFIFSDKQWNSFHRIRHRIYDTYKNNNIEFFGSGCNNRIESKSTGLSQFMFSIIVENSEENDYFTEKVIDCFLTGVIPIYLGNRNIGNYFNEDGIIRFNDTEQLENILPKLTRELYLEKISAVKENFEKAKNYIHPEHLIAKVIQENE